MAHRNELLGLTPGLHRDCLTVREFGAAEPGEEPLQPVCLARMTDFTVFRACRQDLKQRLPAGL